MDLTFWAALAGAALYARHLNKKSKIRLGEWENKVRKAEEHLKRRAETQPRRFLQDSAPGVSSRTDNVYFHSELERMANEAGSKYVWPVIASFLMMLIAVFVVESEGVMAAWAGLALAYALPAVYFGWKEKKALMNTELFERLTLVQLSLYLSNRDEERKRVVERLATDRYVNNREASKQPGVYGGNELAVVQRAARAVWFATDGYCPRCGTRRECRPVVTSEPLLPPKIQALCHKCGAQAVVPQKVIGVVGPQSQVYEFHDGNLYVRLWGASEAETQSLDAVEIRSGGDFSYDHAVVAALQRLENAGFNRVRSAAVGCVDDERTSFYWGELPVIVDAGVELSENTRRLLASKPASSPTNRNQCISKAEKAATFQLLQ